MTKERKQRDNKGRFLPHNNIGHRFKPGNTYNQPIPQYRYICTHCGYNGQYHWGIGGILQHFSNCTNQSISNDIIQVIIDRTEQQYPGNVLNNIAHGYDLSDQEQMAEFCAKAITEREQNNNQIVITSINWLSDYFGIGKD